MKGKIVSKYIQVLEDTQIMDRKKIDDLQMCERILIGEVKKMYTEEEVKEITYEAVRKFSSISEYDCWAKNDILKWFDETYKKKT